MTRKTAAPPAWRDLSSPRHPLLKQIRAALRQGELTDEGCCVLEGFHLLEEALASPVEITALVAAQSAVERVLRLPVADEGGPALYRIPDRVFAGLSDTETPQGVAALVRLPPRSVEECLAGLNPLVLVGVELQDPGNLGTLLRSLEAFGGAACLLAKNSVSPFNAKAVRASAGSVLRVPVFRRLDLEPVLALCREHRLCAIGLSPRAPFPISRLNLREGVALFVGSEAHGLPAALEKQLDAVAHVPLAPPVDSLNAAIAASVALYEAARQRAAE